MNKFEQTRRDFLRIAGKGMVGAAALTAEALAALVGQNITDAKYDTVAGATVTSNAVNQALDTIAAYVR